MEITEIGEFGLIERIRGVFSENPGMLGIGDDCAVIPAGDRDWLVTTDMLLEGTHFLREGISPCDLGWKSLAVNISDIAAMGGEPMASFLSLGVPEGISLEYVDEFLRGFRDLSRKWSVPLLGGDTTRAAGKDGKMAINVGILGHCPSGQAKLRSAALPGDGIYVTGTLGDSSAGLELILKGTGEEYPYLLERHTRPEPRMEEGRILGSMKEVHAMMDISDGIASDLNHILKASGAGAGIELDALPMSGQLKSWASENGVRPEEKAIAGGEDYELLFTAAEGTPIPEAVKATRIGTIVSGSGIRYFKNGRETGWSPEGFDHFKK